MINRFYDPSEGSISYDSVDIKKLDLKCLRDLIGYVSQEPVLILGTIRENLMYGNMNAGEAELREALESANADFVYHLENGLDTYVGSGSMLNLSGG